MWPCKNFVLGGSGFTDPLFTGLQSNFFFHCSYPMSPLESSQILRRLITQAAPVLTEKQISKQSTLESLFRRLRPKLLWAFRSSRDNTASEDAVQDAFLHLLQSKRDPATIGNIEAYLLTTVRRAGLAQLRKKRPTESLDDRDERQSAQYPTEWNDNTSDGFPEEELRNFLKSLGPRRRNIFIWNRIDLMSAEQIASTHNINIHTVRAEMKIGYEMFRSAFDIKPPKK